MRRLFKTLLLVLILTLVFLSACKDDSLSQKAIDQGKLALANSEYDKALASFELALDEGVKNEEVEKLINIIKVFKEAYK